MTDSPLTARETVFITHAAPEDNEFALWLSSQLAMAGYRVWIDRRRLRGGDDTWDEIDRVLRNECIKQVIAFSEHIGKPGVKKELGIGDVVSKRLSDSKFMIPIRIGNISYGDAPPEFLRGNILDGNPNWHNCLKELFETLADADVPKKASPDAALLHALVEAREEGRRFVLQRPEKALTNWFPVKPPQQITYYRFDGVQEQIKLWLDACRLPHTGAIGRMTGSFADLPTFSHSSSSNQQPKVGYAIPFGDFITGAELGPYIERADASRDVSNLLRQHFDQMAKQRGLLPIEFANKQMGWFFPDGLLPSNKLKFDSRDGRTIRRAMTGKFKDLRWHFCLIAKPRIWPDLVYRIHANVVLSEDGKTALPGERTHKRRRRLTKSWWNDIWRDRLLAAMHFLANDKRSISTSVGGDAIEISAWPLEVELSVSYDATDPPPPVEEDEEGNITPTSALDDRFDEFDGEEDSPSGDDEGVT